MGLMDCEDNSLIGAGGKTGKVTNSATLTWKFKVDKAGTIDFYAYATYGGSDSAFVNGYQLKVGDKVGTVDVIGHKLSEFGATATESVFFKVGSVTFGDEDIDENGEISLHYVFPSNQSYRHVYSGSVKIMYVD